MKTWDVIIGGGGIIGLSLSIALRKRGATVLVVERGEPGREASHAAGGMLVPRPGAILARQIPAPLPAFVETQLTTSSRPTPSTQLSFAVYWCVSAVP